jgi:pimeloyl-ACP methyl ester carboxylesterase
MLLVFTHSEPTMPHLTLPHGRLAYDLAGDGPLVVLAPGMGDLRQTWRSIVAPLAAAGFRVASLDLRGHGASDTTFPSYRPDDVADDLRALVAALGGPAILVGHSASAAACLKAAADAPELVAGVALVGPVARDPGGNPPPAWLGTLARAVFLPAWGARLWGWFYRRLFKAAPAPDDHVAAVVAALRDPARRRAMIEVGLSTKATCAARATAVRAPVIALIGDQDPDLDPAVEAAWLRDTCGAQVTLLPGVGHYPHHEAAPAVVAALVALGEATCRAA